MVAGKIHLGGYGVLMTTTQIILYVFICLALALFLFFAVYKAVKEAKKIRASGQKVITSSSIFKTLVFIFLFAYTLTIFLALFWMLMMSLKSLGDYGRNYLFDLPEEFEFSNYITAMDKFKVARSRDNKIIYVTFLGLVVNSLILTIGKTILGIFIPAIVSYLVARFDFKFGKVIYAIVVITMILPIVGTIHSSRQVYMFLGIYDNLFGVLLGSASFLGMNFLLFYSSFKSLPKDYAEAAYLDGAGNTRIMFTIMFPLVKNMLLIVGVLVFIAAWNDYNTVLYYLPSYPNLAYGLYLYNINPDGTLSQIPFRMVGCVLTCLPVFILFMIFKDKMIGNVSLGGLKG